MTLINQNYTPLIESLTVKVGSDFEIPLINPKTPPTTYNLL
jgi:hypothetical protein